MTVPNLKVVRITDEMVFISDGETQWGIPRPEQLGDHAYEFKLEVKVRVRGETAEAASEQLNSTAQWEDWSLVSHTLPKFAVQLRPDALLIGTPPNAGLSGKGRYEVGQHSSDIEHVHVALVTEDGGRDDLFDVALYYEGEPSESDPAYRESLAALNMLVARANAVLS